MASSWGDSWGSSWGDSWGTIGAIEVTPPRSGGGFVNNTKGIDEAIKIYAESRLSEQDLLDITQIYIAYQNGRFKK